MSFEHITGFTFCHVIRISLTYKIGQTDFNVIFKILSYFSSKLFCDKEILQIICLNYEICIILVYWSIFSKNLNVNYNFESKSFIIVLLTRSCVLYYLCTSKRFKNSIKLMQPSEVFFKKRCS